MREIIINLIKKLIVPKYGPIKFHVVGTNDFRGKNYMRNEYGYSIQYDFKSTPRGIPDDVVSGIIDDTNMFLRMLGLHSVYSSQVANSIYIEVLES